MGTLINGQASQTMSPEPRLIISSRVAPAAGSRLLSHLGVPCDELQTHVKLRTEGRGSGIEQVEVGWVVWKDADMLTRYRQK